MTKDDLKIHNYYRFKNNGSNPLVYIGKEMGWNQFEEIDNRGIVWAEVLDEDLFLLEEVG